MASVLGKRLREDDTSPYSTRSKRVTRQVQVHNDENRSPCVDLLPPSITKSTASKLSSLRVSTPSKSKSIGRPAKHGKPERRVAIHPIDGLFKVAKVSTLDQTKQPQAKLSPHTPRHRDATGSILPVTPQNRILDAESSPHTPCTGSRAGPYARARELFTGGCESALLVGRDAERKQVTNFILSNVDRSTGGCLYISGPPGTGKSAFVADIIHGLPEDMLPVNATINCMSIRSSAEFLQTIAADLNLGDSIGKFDSDLLKDQMVSKNTDSLYLLVLDEVDRLVNLDLKLLYSLFEWSMQPASRLILVGIANALDLTDRLLPRLKSRNVKPDLLPFMPYDASQINQIITARLKSLKTDSADSSFLPFVHPAAIMLCSKKVASSTGDLRKAFDIVRRALSLAESEARTSAVESPLKSLSRAPLSENINLSSPPVEKSPAKTEFSRSTSLSHLTAETAPRATITHVAKVTSQIFSNGTSSRLGQINIHQKAVLCALVSFEKNARSSLAHSLSSMTSFVPPTPSKSGRGKISCPTVMQLYASYVELCNRYNTLNALTRLEFKDVISNLETLSLVEYVDGKRKGTLGLMTPTRTPSRKGRKGDSEFGQMNLGGFGEEPRVTSVVGFVELKDGITGPGSDILLDILEG